MKSTIVGAIAVLAMLSLTACLVPPNNYRSAPAPCSATVSAISGNSLVIAVPISFTYTPKDSAEGATYLRQVVLDRLNEKGRLNSNSFSLQNGSALNFTLNFSINNNNEIYTGSLSFSGWGQGFIHNFYTNGQYNNPTQMMQDLTDQAYAFIQDGWHDSRPQCSK